MAADGEQAAETAPGGMEGGVGRSAEWSSSVVLKKTFPLVSQFLQLQKV